MIPIAESKPTGAESGSGRRGPDPARENSHKRSAEEEGQITDPGLKVSRYGTIIRRGAVASTTALWTLSSMGLAVMFIVLRAK